MKPCTTCGEPACNIYCGLCLKDYCLRQHEHSDSELRILVETT
jgi:hypothetical protein